MDDQNMGDMPAADAAADMGGETPAMEAPEAAEGEVA
jgi:hypothetical protein